MDTAETPLFTELLGEFALRGRPNTCASDAEDAPEPVAAEPDNE